jgi:hypothetical protein
MFFGAAGAVLCVLGGYLLGRAFVLMVIEKDVRFWRNVWQTQHNYGNYWRDMARSAEYRVKRGLPL